jgi:hypothetical protein
VKPGIVATILDPDGNEAEVCGLCRGLERFADAPCPWCVSIEAGGSVSGARIPGEDGGMVSPSSSRAQE